DKPDHFSLDEIHPIVDRQIWGRGSCDFGHKKHDFRNFVSRNQRRFECGKVPNRVDRKRPKEQYYGLDNRLPNLCELS
ncbi:MAG: hypothetical protein WB036_12090, partial [Pseudolabrys sp.]